MALSFTHHKPCSNCARSTPRLHPHCSIKTKIRCKPQRFYTQTNPVTQTMRHHQHKQPTHLASQSHTLKITARKLLAQAVWHWFQNACSCKHAHINVYRPLVCTQAACKHCKYKHSNRCGFKNQTSSPILVQRFANGG